MKKMSILLLCILVFNGCLKAKKSPFDLNSPLGFIFGFVFGQTYSVGGTITGFTSGTLVLQNNSKDDLTLTATDKYSFSGISSGSTYIISVKSHPSGFACKIENSKGTVSSNVTNANLTCFVATVNALYTLGDSTKSYWMDYVKSDGTSPINATGTACTGSETGFYNACVHAGEFKKVEIPNITSCDNITASDSLSAFNWKCVVASDNSVSVISTGLRADKGLSDLIDFTSPGSFRNNSVIVTLSGNSFLTSTTGKWWDNAIDNSKDTTGIPSSAVSRTIYIITTATGPAAIYRLDADKVGLVVKPGIIKYIAAGGASIIVSNKFSWVEASLDSQNDNLSIQMTSGNPKFNMIRNTYLLTDVTGNSVISVNVGGGNFFSNIKIVATDSTGSQLINLNNDKNIFNGLYLFNSQKTGLWLSFADNIISNFISASNSGVSILSDSSSYKSNLIQNLTLANNSGIGILFNSSAPSRFTFNNSLVVNHGANNGIDNSLANFMKFINTISAHNGTAYADATTSSNSIFNGILKVSSTCNTTGATSPGLNNSCTKINSSEVSPATETGISLSNSFVGQVSADSKNSSHTNGTKSFASISDWFNFQNSYRNWGIQGTFPTSAVTGKCSSGTCQIWDWSLKSTDSVVRNVNACPNGTIVDTHLWSDTTATQAICDANYKGSIVNGSTTCVTTFLRNAVEIFGDGVGNENGICESNEECLYTPNIGAYQGHSSDSSNPTKLVKADTTSSTNSNNCSDIGTGGTITNVKLWKYDTNGY